ncbi:MAG: sigma-70 family RNA polymerase sigma factor [Planctomycetaceae bacterium]|nr:MAG: sigma-70 family RNA polymerase sigma factor [Planctomycetaceae bacterium]
MSIPSAEVLLLDYDHYITGVILRLKHGCVNPVDLQDLKAQVALRLVQSDWLSRYDEGQARMTTVLYWIVRAVVINDFRYRKYRETVLLDPAIEAACSDLMDAATERRLVAYDWADRFERYLWRQVPASAPQVTVQGRTYPRGPALVFHLMRREWTNGEIAQALGMSRPGVSTCVRRIKDLAVQFEAAPAAA